jgi:hypothetical protein
LSQTIFRDFGPVRRNVIPIGWERRYNDFNKSKPISNNQSPQSTRSLPDETVPLDNSSNEGFIIALKGKILYVYVLNRTPVKFQSFDDSHSLGFEFMVI